MIAAFCLHKYFPFGGLQRDFLRIARATKNLGIDIRVYVEKWEGDKPSDFEILFVPTTSISNYKRGEEYNAWVMNHIKSNPVDAVIGFNKMPGLDFYYQADTSFAEKAASKPFFYTWLPRNRHYLEYEKATFGAGQKTKLLMISDRQIAIYQKYHHTETERFILLPPGISADRKYSNLPEGTRSTFRKNNNIPEETFLIIQVGSDFHRKGADRSILAVAALPDNLRSKVLLMIVGQDKPDKLQVLVKTHHLEQHVQICAGRNDIPQLIAAADLLVHPARIENTGTVLLESIVGGCPLIVTDACGYADHVRKAQCGIVLEDPFLQQSYDAAIHACVSGNVNLKTMALAARHYADTQDLYSLPEQVANLIAQHCRY